MAQLTKDYDNLVGDVLVSAGMIAYSGPFTPDFRQKLVKGWQEKLVELGIPHSDGCDVRLTLADPVQVWKSNEVSKLGMVCVVQVDKREFSQARSVVFVRVVSPAHSFSCMCCVAAVVCPESVGSVL